MPKLTQGNLNRLPVIAPPLAEQRAIAGVLGALDDKIELNRRMNTTLETMARALFQSWFVDFDPVRLRLSCGGQLRASRDNPAGLPAEALAKAGLDPATAALFPEHLEDSPLGHIPKGWEVCSLANKIELLSGGTPKTSEPDYWDGNIPWYSVKDVSAVGQKGPGRVESGPFWMALREICRALGGTISERQVRVELAALRVLGLASSSGHGAGARWRLG